MMYLCYHIIQLRLIHPRIYAYPQGILHHLVGIGQLPHYTIAGLRFAHRIDAGLAQVVASEEVSRLDVFLLQITCEIRACIPLTVVNGKEETEPAGIRMLRGLRQNENILSILQPLGQIGPILFALLDKCWQLVQLGTADRRL